MQILLDISERRVTVRNVKQLQRLWPPVSEDELRKVLRTAGTKTAAATQLGVSRPTLDSWIKHYGIEVRTRTLQLA